MPDIPGDKPCTELQTRGGTWRYSADKLDQHFSPAQRYATGIRNGEGFGIDSSGRLFVTQHGRDQLWENWTKLYNPDEGQNEPAEELLQLTQGADYGWPECYYDYTQKKLVLAPEYGGDGGKKLGVCSQKQGPVAAAAPAPAVQQASGSGAAQPPEGIHPNAGLSLPTPPGGSPDQVVLGERIFQGEADHGTCAGCHGPDGKGSDVGSNLTSGHWLWSDGSVQGITRTIERGVPKPKEHTGSMPPEGGVKLSQADVAAVANYVWALGHSKSQ
jgi:mono/diheme cytochrome c family protein